MPPALTQIASRLSPRGWLIVGGSAVAAILFVYLFLHTVSQPSYSTLVTGLNPSETGKMTNALSEHGVNYQLQNNGTALAVQSNQTAQARIALAGVGLLGQTQPDFSLFEKQNLGESNFQQQVTYQRALQGQLAETIDAIQGVSGAQVELVLPNSQSQLFGESQSSSAAVLLSGASSLDPGSVKGIAQLVASSVPGLQLSKVTITDGTGQLLWPNQSSDGTSGAGTSVQDAEQRYDQSMAASLDGTLGQIVGQGKAQVLVYANMNVNQTTQESLTYGKAGVPLKQSKDIETLTGNGSGGGATGTANIPAAAQTTGGKSNYKRETTNSSLGVDKTVTHSTIAPGTVESQHVSVLLDHSVPAASLPAIREAVTNAAGIQPKRGDTISIGQVAFAKPTGVSASPTSGILGDAKYVLVGIGAIIFLFFTTRHLRRREEETIDHEPRWLRELEVPVRLSELDRESPARRTEAMVGVAPNGNGHGGNGNGNGNGGNGNGNGNGDHVRRQVEQLADSDPDRVAKQLRNWMQEG
ncbi:MAG TPA: flagellar basal-body MS-ring/collar protein FliF [Solirubrobacteraceae bacterium]|jgi:flagellar M-ring protein FliF|nr:flagellar basal-body MS-ring/collar protein FliF [Solirubrobacteraceae bacterium]